MEAASKLKLLVMNTSVLLVSGSLNRIRPTQIDPLEKIFVADTVNLHAFMDEQSFGLLNH
jgi:hypothetical protein